VATLPFGNEPSLGPTGIFPAPAGTNARRHRMKLPWREEILKYWGVTHVSIDTIDTSNHIWTSRCARTKLVRKGKPRELYRSDLLDEFYRFVESKRVRYGIVSDAYGLHMDEEVLPYYDVHPSALSASDKRKLGEAVGCKAALAGFRSLVFFAHSPLMSRPYFEILACSELQILFVTTLRSGRS
jgi:hypothetical protein